MRVLMTALLLAGAVTTRAGTVLTAEAAACRVSTDPALADHGVAATAGTLAWCLEQVGAGDAQILIPGPHRYTLSGNLIVPANVTLVFERGAVLVPGAAAVLTLDAGIEAGPWQIFAGRPEAFSGRPKVDFVRAQWWGKGGAALAAALRFGTVFLGSDTFTVDAAVVVPSDTVLYGAPGARIVSTVSGNPHTYFGLLTTPAETRVRNITIRDIAFSNREAVGMYAFCVAGGGENITFANCEAEGCGLVFATNVRNLSIRDSWCHSSALEQYGSFDDHHDGIYLNGASEDCIIRGNRIRDWRCHGIAVVAEAVFPPTSLDPTREMLAKRILVEGNTVVARVGKETAGGIWFSAVQDCRVVNNHVEGYGDVGIDFEGSRNCVASGNVLVNNGRNLALFGNCRNILFSNNIVEITRDDVPMTVFLNTYSNAYPTIVDTRNTDIVVANNTFSTRVRTYNAQHGTGNVIVGTAKRIVFRNNTFINCRLISHYCDDAEHVEVVGNTFFNDFKGTAFEAVQLAVSGRGGEVKQPARTFILRDNTFKSVNDTACPGVVQFRTLGVLPDQAPHCDVRLVVHGNVFDRETASLPALLVEDNYQHGNYLDMRFDCVIRQNTANSPLEVRIPRGGEKKTVTLLMEGNSPAAEDFGQAGQSTAP